MRNKERSYSFILSHTTRNKVRIRRIELSKRLVQFGSSSALVLLIFTSFGLLAGFGESLLPNFGNGFADSSAGASLVSASSKANHKIPENLITLNYDRPSSTDEFAQNSGGPVDGTFQLAAVDSDREESEIEKRLRTIESTSDAKFIPTIWAHLGKINNEFGFRRNPFGGRSYEFHSGMDIDGDKGDIIVSPANGRISKAGWQGGYGYMIEIDHGNGLKTRYGHLSKLDVKEGDPVQRGQLLGYVGSTGRSTGPHLHYELRVDNKPINPRRFLPPEPTRILG